jgi:hypothetical protein
MPRKSKKTKAEVIAAIDPAVENAICAAPIDHDSQLASWDRPAETEAPVETPWSSNEEIQRMVFGPPSDDELAAELDGVIETNPGEFSTTIGIEDAETVEEPIQEVQATEASAETVQEPQAVTFAELRKSFDKEQVEDVVFATASECDERAFFEEAKNADNTNIQRTLKKVRSQLVTMRAAEVLLATSVEPTFINRTLHDGARYNVYALGKLADLVFGVTDGVIANAINIACMKSLFRFRAAGIPFTGEHAKMAASDKIRVADKAVRDALVRHTVSASTAPTQASSTMQALETLGVVRREGSSRNPTFTLTGAPIVQKLEEMLKAA